MMKKILKLVESVLSPEEMDILNTYSKPTPNYELDREIELAKSKGYDIRIVKEYPYKFLLDVFKNKERINSISIDKKDLLNNNVDIINLIRSREDY
ncbi:MAG TPA: hypothetical protein DEG71_04845 [Clostridiales bacterium]|nr:hypothetical protein [Clostridiales bacterium]